MQKFNSFRTQIIVRGQKQPLECPVCKFVLRDSEDVISVKSEKACTECTINFKHINLEKWLDGWRPSIEKARSKMYI
jgi:hypothetical protein